MTDHDALVKELQELVSRWVDLSERWAVHAARAIATLEQQAAEIARLRALLTEAVERVEAGDLDQRMCCDGHMCGCQGSTNADQFLHYARQALKGQP